MNNENLRPILRRATLADAATLASVGVATFSETFGHLYPPEDLESFLTNSHSVDAWNKTLSDDKRATWVVSIDESTLIGFITVGACKLPVENREVSAGEIQQLYVLAQYHNLRLGSKLMTTGLQWLEAQNFAPLYIGVWSENYGAQRFYARYGFNKVGEYGFPVGKTVDREFILKR